MRCNSGYLRDGVNCTGKLNEIVLEIVLNFVFVKINTIPDTYIMVQCYLYISLFIKYQHL